MPKRGRKAAPGQHAASRDQDGPEWTGCTAEPAYGSPAFVGSHACATNLERSDVGRDNARPEWHPERRPGWAMAFALEPLGLHEVPEVYLKALRRLRAMRQVTARYKRPTRTSPGGTTAAGAYGIFSKVPPEERLVAEELDCWAHAREARRLFFPERLPGSELGPVILQAIDLIVDLGPDLERTRRTLTAEWRAIGESLRPLSRALVGTMPAHAKGIMREANLLMVAAHALKCSNGPIMARSRPALWHACSGRSVRERARHARYRGIQGPIETGGVLPRRPLRRNCTPATVKADRVRRLPDVAA